jgi:cellobiose-specific phosphotransferase system component IIA
MDEKQPLLKNENQSQIDIESGGNCLNCAHNVNIKLLKNASNEID